MNNRKTLMILGAAIGAGIAAGFLIPRHGIWVGGGAALAIGLLIAGLAYLLVRDGRAR